MNFHCKNRIPKCIWNQRHPRIDCFTSYQSYLRTNNLIMTYLREKTWTQPMNHSCHTNQPTTLHVRSYSTEDVGAQGDLIPCPAMASWEHPSMKVKMVKSGQIPQYLWGFLSGKNTKKMEKSSPNFYVHFFVERKSINGGKSPNVYVYVFSFCGENPLSMEVYSSLGKSPRRNLMES